MNIRTSQKTFTSANILEVEFGTNCPQGGDAGHNGVTLFRLKDHAGTSTEIRYGGKPIGELSGGDLELVLYGDTECETFMKALRFAVKVYGKKRHPWREL